MNIFRLFLSQLEDLEHPDEEVLAPVVVEDSGGGYVPRIVKISFGYIHKNPHEKQILSSQIMFLSADENLKDRNYSFTVHFYPLTYWEAFDEIGFDNNHYMISFCIVSGIVLLISIVAWIITLFYSIIKHSRCFSLHVKDYLRNQLVPIIIGVVAFVGPLIGLLRFYIFALRENDILLSYPAEFEVEDEEEISDDT